MQESIPRTRFETLIIALLYESNSKGISINKIREVAKLISSDGIREELVLPPRDEKEVLSYINYLKRKGIIVEKDDKLFLRAEKLSPPMRHVIAKILQRHKLSELL